MYIYQAGPHYAILIDQVGPRDLVHTYFYRIKGHLSLAQATDKFLPDQGSFIPGPFQSAPHPWPARDHRSIRLCLCSACSHRSARARGRPVATAASACGRPMATGPPVPVAGPWPAAAP